MSLLELHLACGEHLDVHRFSVQEAVSSPFHVKVLARSPDPCIDLKALLGQPAALRVVGTARTWSGLCNHVRLVQAVELGVAETGLSTYEIRIVPRLWLLGRRTDYRSFQHLSIPDIARKVLEEWGIEATFRVDAAEHPRLVYKVQYGETDLDFLSRLLEEAGIAYTFADEAGDSSRLVLSDALHRSAPRREPPIQHVERPTERAPRELVTRLSLDEHLPVEAVTIRDHDFQRPAWALLGEARHAAAHGPALERCRYQPGAFLIEIEGGATGHDDRYGAALAARALEAERADRCVVSFETNAIDLLPGVIVAVEDHPRPEIDPREGLLVTSVSIDGSPHGDWTVRVTAAPASTPHRPALRTAKPRVTGVQSATVIGAEGEEIDTDVHGRVRVQFPWDREAQGSCWMRVAQGWAGPGLGFFAPPRVGQEVLVAFLDGDPDQPIVVGRVPNVLNPPPLRLPQDRTQSVWRSATSPGGDGFNEIRMEDRKGGELVSVRAQRDMAIAVHHHRAQVVGGDETSRTEGEAVAYVGRDAHRTIEGEQRERIGAKRSLTVEGDQHERVAGSAALEAGEEIHFRSATRLVLEAPDVTLKAAGGFVRIDDSGVTVAGIEVRIQDGGAPGEGHGADPALPPVPLRADQERAPPQLPLLGFPPGVLPPMPAQPPGRGGGPLTPDEATICEFICLCARNPSPHTRPSDCLTARLRALDAASGGTSRLKAEVPYDMSQDPPAPIMSRNEPGRPTRGKPKGSSAPDVIVVKDPSKPPTQDNIEKVVEIKFEGDRFRGDQKAEYQKIAGPAPFKELSPKRCGCPDREREQEQEVTAEDVAMVLLLAALVVILAVDDLAPGGQADDAAIPPAIQQLLSRLAPLLRGFGPVIP